MILDAENQFSDKQAITASAASTNVVDLGVARDLGVGKAVPINIQVTEAFATLTSLDIAIETDDNSGFSSATVLATQTILVADLVAGAKAAMQYFPRGSERYIRINYTVNGSDATTGKITAGIVDGHQEGSFA